MDLEKEIKDMLDYFDRQLTTVNPDNKKYEKIRDINAKAFVQIAKEWALKMVGEDFDEVMYPHENQVKQDIRDRIEESTK